MKPLPAQPSPISKTTSEVLPALTSDLPATGIYSSSNRRTGSCPIHSAYPWLLGISTAIAASFCLLYITKPVISSASNMRSESLPSVKPSPAKPSASALTASAAATNLLPDSQSLPGDSRGNPATPRAALTSAIAKNPFEESNLRVQHILTAEAPGGHLSRIDVEVPVLYQSRNLRWTQSEVAEARALLLRLANYQEKSQTLRAEASELLESWNQLVNRSIPQAELRADSPTLPINQQDAVITPQPAGSNTDAAIQIQSSGK